MGDSRQFADVVGYPFRNHGLVMEARTHSSLLNEAGGAGRNSNARLAHVGDAVVELAVRLALFERFPRADKQQLSDAADKVVSDAALGKVAAKMGLAAFLDRGGSRPMSADNETVLAEAFEAAMGAVFVDSDFETAAAVIAKHVTMPDRL